MAKLNINIGSSANDKTGDPLRTAFSKVNANFTELYTLTGGASTALTELAQDYAAPLFNHASHTNITVTYDDANNKILLTGVASAVWPVANTNNEFGPTRIAIGNSAGGIAQGSATVAVGSFAGNDTQGGAAVAIGTYAGTTTQRNDAIAIGYLTGNDVQGTGAVSIGRQAGQTSQGAYSIAIGKLAGQTSQAANTIILNSTNSALNGVASQTNSFYVSPIRSATATSDVLYYNTTTKEITYAAAGSVSSLVNGANTVSLDSNSNLTFTNGEQIKTNFLGGGIELYQSSDNTIGIYPGGAEIKTFVTGGPKYKWLFGITGNTTFPTGLILGAPRGAGTVNFTSAIDKEFQIETQTSSTSKLWQFDTAGTTTFPSGLTLHRLSTPYSNITADLDKILQVATQTSGGRKEWTFGTNGSLTLPIGVSIDNNVDPLYPKIIADSGKLFSVQGQGTSGSAALSWTVNPAAAGQYAAVAVSRAGGDNLAKVVIQAQSNSGDVGTAKLWKFDETGNLTFPDATVQSTAYLAPTTGNSVIDSVNPSTISRNGMTIRVTSAGMIQMSFNSVIGITGRSSINNADSAVISSPNGATVISTWYNIGAVLAVGDHLTATIVDASFHRIYRLTVTMRDRTTGPDSATAYAIIEQIQ
jgi:hypothetical protein